MMRIRLYSLQKIGYLLVLVLSQIVLIAHADTKTAETAVAKQDADKVFWPMMRGESVSGLAEMLYPDSPILRERFIEKTRAMSRNVHPSLDVNAPFNHPQMIVIPNDHAVRALTHKIKRYEDVSGSPSEEKTKKRQLNFSYSLKNPPPIAKTAQPATQKQDKPAAKLPQMKMPEIHAPDIAIPEFKMPAIKTDEMKTWLGDFWYQARTGFANLVTKTRGFLIQAVQDSTNLVADYKGKSVDDIVNDYRLRNGILFSFLAVMGIAFWVISNRRAKKQRQSISALASTIKVEPSLKSEESVKPAEAETENLPVLEQITAETQEANTASQPPNNGATNDVVESTDQLKNLVNGNDNQPFISELNIPNADDSTQK